jgi:hypothetical protein
VAGFASTAAYFERLAQKETRDEDRRQRLMEVAGFYRALAGIIPGIPERYKANCAGLPWRGRSAGTPTLRRVERWPIASPIPHVADN